MLSIPGYKISEKLYQNNQSIVFRAENESDGRKVVLKVLQREFPGPEEVARFKQEFAIMQELNFPGVVDTYDLLDYGSNFVLVMEDFDGIDLKKYVTSRDTLDTSTFLKVAIQMADILEKLHTQNIIHKDIKPLNILINAETGEVKLADFGISSVIDETSEKQKDAESVQGTLAYMSPEQTGRINRKVDHRSDLYSLGVTFFEMFTGRPPFQSADALETIHMQIAKAPPSPRELNEDTPEQLALIILKLLEKSAEARYQGATGLAYDLRKCQGEFDKTGAITIFTPGEQDRSLRFNIPEKLYGRETDLKILLASFERASRGRPEMTLVGGYSGIGKSVLINEIRLPIIETQGNFIAGKYDQYNRNVPFSAFIQALKSLTSKILSESDERVARWKARILEALGPNAQIIIDIIPDVELLIGSQPELAHLGPEESQNRFNNVFRNFLRVFAAAEHPLVIFLDDLQWADRGSLALLQNLITDHDLAHLFMIVAYRDNEVNDSHPFMLTVEDIRKAGAKVNHLELKPLEEGPVNEMIAAGCRRAPEETLELTGLVHRKTGGNPFFVKEFMNTLYREGLLVFEVSKGWTWDLTKIQEMKSSDNVVELMTEKMTGLPEQEVRLLAAGACLGASFQLPAIAGVLGLDLEAAYKNIRTVLEEGFCLRVGDGYRFAHDRIQEAAYRLVDEGERAEFHYRAGRSYLDTGDAEHIQKNIFFIVTQMNGGRERIQDPKELWELAELNLKAGLAAMGSAAYDSALEFLSGGILCLDANAWESGYETAFSLHMEKAECLFMSGEAKEAEKLFDVLLKHAKSKTDRCRIYNLRIMMHNNREEFVEAIAVGREALGELYRVKMPTGPGQIAVVQEVLKTNMRMKKNMDDLYNLPEMTDPDMKMIMTIFMYLAPPAYFTDANLLIWIMLRMVQYSLKYGNCEFSAYGYIGYGLVMVTPAMQKYRKGHEVAELSVRLNEKFQNVGLRAKIHHIKGCIVSLWSRPFEENLQSLRTAYDYGVETGDLTYAAYAFQCNSQIKVTMGLTLEEIQGDIDRYSEFLELAKDLGVLNNVQCRRLFIKNLRGETRKTDSFDTEEQTEADFLNNVKDANNLYSFCIYHIYKAMSLYFTEFYEEALEQSLEADKYLEAIIGQSLNYDHYLFQALIAARLYGDSRGGKRKQLGKILGKNVKQLATWAKSCPENFANGYYLVRAEIERLQGKNRLKTMDYYKQAYAAVEKSRAILFRALTDQLTAEYYFQTGYDSIGKSLMSRAISEFSAWGSSVRYRLLSERYPELAVSERNVEPAATGTTSTMIGTISTMVGTAPGRDMSSSLDLNSLLKAAQAISSEVNLEKVQEKMMRILMENTGAESGYFLLSEGDKLMVDVHADLQSDSVKSLKSVPYEESSDVPHSIIRYVVRTHEHLVLDNAWVDSRFREDPWVQERKTKSVLCNPIFSSGRVTGVIYLENNLTESAFTGDRIELLHMLSSQAAVSIDNARLYSGLEEKVKKRTEELTNTLEEVRTLKHQQDGDYFLTTLVANPLSKNSNNSEAVTTDFRIAQKKSFNFKHWSGHLGGDICVTGNLKIKGIPYTFFMNGDAMGKSMQGAGGAIVMGTVVNSLLARYSDESKVTQRNPREWLRDIYFELNSVFMSFDGAMAISCVIGLIEEGTGLLTFFNAEHPFCVLYRGGRSRFLQKDMLLRKLGLVSQSFKCLQFQLKKGDVLFVSSDGKDDIQLNSGGVNDDENLFLDVVLEGHGELDSIFTRLGTFGEFKDDCSIMRIGYREGANGSAGGDDIFDLFENMEEIIVYGGEI